MKKQPSTSTPSPFLTIPLHGLRCIRCAKKISAQIEQLDGVTSVSADISSLKVNADAPIKQIAATISSLGYGAGNLLSFNLSGLSCANCVNKLNNAINNAPGIFTAKIDKTHADIISIMQPAEIMSLIEGCGFQATALPKPSNATLTLSAANSNLDITEENREVADVNQPPQVAPSNTPISSLFHASHDDSLSQQLILFGMTCASCVKTVETAISHVSGVTSVNVNFAQRTAQVGGNVSTSLLIQAIYDAGYRAELCEDEHRRRQRQATSQAEELSQHKHNTLLAFAVGAPLMLWGLFGGKMSIDGIQSQLAWGVIALVTLALLASAGQHFFLNALKAARHHRATMDTLVAIGTGSAWLYSTAVVLAPALFPEQARHVYFEASAMILGLVSLGHVIETKARASTSSALERLLDLQPPTAIIVENGQERVVALMDVKAGMRLRIKPGAKIPVDGIVESGESYVDESMLTGEPLATHKTAGCTLHAGTVNNNGSLLFIATEIGANTMLARIIHLVHQAQNSKPELARMADTVSAIFVPAVMIVAIITALIWYNFGPEPKFSFMLSTAMTVLIIACPCALGLATPMSVITGIGRGAELGLLIRDANVLQLAAKIDTVVLDKTGTLTQCKPQVTSIVALTTSEDQLLQIAASLEQGSEHPLAKALLDAALAKQLPLLTIDKFQSIPGKGLQSNIQQQRYFLGNARLMDDNKIDISAVDENVRQQAQQGVTLVFLARATALLGVIGISDPVRPDSADAVARLIKHGYQVVMLTGDQDDTANAIAKQVGIDTVFSGVLPDGKAAIIATLQAQNRHVAMVGDGINDAPALALADVGIAMGNGSDVAIESAQITLMRHSIHAAVDALELANATLGNMKQNLFGAFIYNAIGIPLAAGILYPLTGSLLSPVIAGAAMALSSITVVSNANRLRWFTPRTGTHHVG